MFKTIKIISFFIVITMLMLSFQFFAVALPLNTGDSQVCFIKCTYSGYYLEPGSNLGGYYDMSQRQYKITGNTCQQFRITKLSNGYYRIESMIGGGGLSLDAEPGGSRILAYPNTTNNNQQWQITQNSDGSYRIINRANGNTFMNSGSGSGYDGSRIVQWPYRSYLNYMIEDFHLSVKSGDTALSFVYITDSGLWAGAVSTYAQISNTHTHYNSTNARSTEFSLFSSYNMNLYNPFLFTIDDINNQSLSITKNGSNLYVKYGEYCPHVYGHIYDGTNHSCSDYIVNQNIITSYPYSIIGIYNTTLSTNCYPFAFQVNTNMTVNN